MHQEIARPAWPGGKCGRPTLSTCLALIFLACPGLAHATVFDCVAKFPGGTRDWVDGRTVITLDERKGSFTAQSAVTLAVSDKPVRGSFLNLSDERILFGWEVSVKDIRGQETRMRYRAHIRQDDTFLLQADPDGYTNSFHANGRCKRG